MTPSGFLEIYSFRGLESSAYFRCSILLYSMPDFLFSFDFDYDFNEKIRRYHSNSFLKSFNWFYFPINTKKNNKNNVATNFSNYSILTLSKRIALCW